MTKGGEYSARLFDPSNSPDRRPLDHEERGMTPSILPKYGVGCTPHRFPADKGDGAVDNEIG